MKKDSLAFLWPPQYCICSEGNVFCHKAQQQMVNEQSKMKKVKIKNHLIFSVEQVLQYQPQVCKITPKTLFLGLFGSQIAQYALVFDKVFEQDSHNFSEVAISLEIFFDSLSCEVNSVVNLLPVDPIQEGSQLYVQIKLFDDSDNKSLKRERFCGKPSQKEPQDIRNRVSFIFAFVFLSLTAKVFYLQVRIRTNIFLILIIQDFNFLDLILHGFSIFGPQRYRIQGFARILFDWSRIWYDLLRIMVDCNHFLKYVFLRQIDSLIWRELSRLKVPRIGHIRNEEGIVVGMIVHCSPKYYYINRAKHSQHIDLKLQFINLLLHHLICFQFRKNLYSPLAFSCHFNIFRNSLFQIWAIKNVFFLFSCLQIQIQGLFGISCTIQTKKCNFFSSSEKELQISQNLQVENFQLAITILNTLLITLPQFLNQTQKYQRKIDLFLKFALTNENQESKTIGLQTYRYIYSNLNKIIGIFMTTYLETRRSPLNDSRSKQLYSFPKAHRFTESNYISPAPYYDNNITALGKRSTSLGYGNKFTLESKEHVPSPNNYSKQGLFQVNAKKAKGYSFTHDSKKSLINQYEAKMLPGPGKYVMRPDRTDFKRISYSIRGKYEDPLQTKKSRIGPGQYQTVPALNGTGHYFVSKYSNSGCSKIGNSKRFTPIDTISPGPGKYQDAKLTGLNTTGIYFNSTLRTSKAAAFSHSIRKQIAQPSITPGPGSYSRFSDFPNIKK